MALILDYTTTPPTMDTQIYMDTFREGATIRIVVSAVCTFRYNDGYLNPNYYGKTYWNYFQTQRFCR